MNRSAAFPKLLPVVAVAALGLMLGLGTGGCGHQEAGHTPPPAFTVAAMPLAPATEVSFTEATGTVRAAKDVMVASKIMGTVTEIRKKAGDAIRQGEVLIVIDSRDVAGQIAQAEGALAQARAAATIAETNFHRFEQLQARGAASQLELDQARFNHETAIGAVKQAEGALATASSYRSYASIPAPFDGVVVDRLCDEGDMAAPGRPLLKVEDSSGLRLYASLEASRQPPPVGTAIEVVVPDLLSEPIGGTLAEVTPAADPMTRSILLKIDLPRAAHLKAGVYARARIPGPERQALWIPRTSVVHRGGLTGVFVVENGKAAFHLVTLGTARGDDREVLSGLDAGDVLVLQPPTGLEIGSPLEVRS